MIIRELTLEDIDTVVEMGEIFHEEAPHFRHLPFSARRFKQFLINGLDDPKSLCLLAIHDGEIIGSFAASIFSTFMSEKKLACDNWLYLIPSARKTHYGLIAINELIKEYKAWATTYPNIGDVLIGVNTGIKEESTVRLLTRLGAEHYGTMMRF